MRFIDDDFHMDRVQSNMNDVIKEYSLGKRIFDKYDIEDNWRTFNGIILDDAKFSRCFIEACFNKCSFKNAIFQTCNLKTVQFINCNLMNAAFDECLIESIDFTNSILEGIKLGKNHAYGGTLDGKI